MLISLILLGLTCAYFLTQITGNTSINSISVTTANLQVKYVEGNDVIEPTEKILLGFTATKTFSVTSEGYKATNYSVYLIQYLIVLQEHKIEHMN